MNMMKIVVFMLIVEILANPSQTVDYDGIRVNGSRRASTLATQLNGLLTSSDQA